MTACMLNFHDGSDQTFPMPPWELYVALPLCFGEISDTLIQAVFSRAIFQVAERMTTGKIVKTVGSPTRLKLSESANFSGIAIKFKPPNQVA